jgi:uncharacterized membrane protein
MQNQPPDPPQAATENIAVVARLEQDFLQQRTWSERLADRIAAFVGSMPFVGLHLLWFALWITVNTNHVPVIRAFDPFPFILLSLMVSCEGVLLSTFVLMKQNRMSRAADARAHLNLQIDMLAEKEITKILQLQQMMCERMEIRADDEAKELSRETAVDRLAEHLSRQLPAEE